MKNKDNSMKFLLLTLIIGLGIFFYPHVSNWWNEFHQSRAIMQYEESIAAFNAEEYANYIEKAKKYNQMIAENGIKWVMTEEEKEEYYKVLNIDGTGNMGYISIPKIKINLPLYHSVSEDVLQRSIGHIEGSSFPVGGETSHSMVSGHRGLPSAKLFSELDKLSEGDRWTVSILNETYTYEVDQIRTVEPDDLQFLQLEEGQDLMTLITCTPYGVNTHRLLIRGHRVQNEDGNARIIAEALQIEPIFIAPFVAVPLALFLLIIFTNSTNKKMNSNKSEKQMRDILIKGKV